MDESAVERARERVEQRADTLALEGILERTRAELAALAETASAAASELPEKVEHAVQDGLRDQVVPVGRNLAEIRGLLNQVLHRLGRLEADSVEDRHARVDDLALLVDLIEAGWKGVDARLGRVETILSRLEQGLQERGGAIVYRIEDHRPDPATTLGTDERAVPPAAGDS